MTKNRHLSVLKNSTTVFDDELDSDVLGVHVCHFTFYAQVAHDGRCKHDGQVFGRHLYQVSTASQQSFKVQLTKFSGSRCATRVRWNMRNSKQSLCA